MKVSINEWWYENKINERYGRYHLAWQTNEGYEVLKETEKAVQIELLYLDNDQDEEYYTAWVPKSMTMKPEEYNEEQNELTELGFSEISMKEKKQRLYEILKKYQGKTAFN